MSLRNIALAGLLFAGAVHAAPNLKDVKAGVVAVKTAKGYYIIQKAPQLKTAADVLAQADRSAPGHVGVPVERVRAAAVDEPYAKPGSQFYLGVFGTNGYNNNPGHAVSRTEFAWQSGYGSKSVSVAVLDQVFPENHPALAAAYDKANAYDVRNNQPGPWMSTADIDPNNGTPKTHGAGVAGVIFSDFNQLSGLDRSAGVAPGASLMPVNICCYVDSSGVEDREAADSVSIANGILYAAGLANSTGKLPSHKADAIVIAYDLFNNADAFNKALDDAINAALDAGVVIFTSSGNGGRLSGATARENSTSARPGFYVVSGASIYEGEVASNATNGSAVDLSAEFTSQTAGVYLDSNNQFVYGAAQRLGTSFSAPFAAGLFALAKSIDPALTLAMFDQWVTSDQATFPNEYLYGYDQATYAADHSTRGHITRTGARDVDFGWGIVDAKRISNLARTAAGLPVIDKLPNISTSAVATQSSNNGNNYLDVVIRNKNPYASSSLLGFLSTTMTWNKDPSGANVKARTTTTYGNDPSNCPYRGFQGGNTNETTVTDIGATLPGNGGSCDRNFGFLTNGYNGVLEVKTHTESLFAGSSDTTTSIPLGSAASPVSGLMLAPSKTDALKGSTIQVTWSSTNAKACTASGGWSGTLAASGTQDVVLPAATGPVTFTLTCTNDAPSSASTSATVNVVEDAGVGFTFGSSSSSVVAGTPVTLTWAAPNASTCVASGAPEFTGAKATSGSQAVTFASAGDRTLVLNCSNAASSAQKSVPVSVSSAPIAGGTSGGTTGGTSGSGSGGGSSSSGGGAFPLSALMLLFPMVWVRNRRRA